MFRKRWLVEVTQNPSTLWDEGARNRWYRTVGRSEWPVTQTKWCWTRTGAHLWAGRFVISPNIRVRVKDTGRIS